MAVEPLYLSIGSPELDEITMAATQMVQAVRAHMCSPDSRKHPPTFSSTEICNITKLTKPKFHQLAKKYPELPRGKLSGNRLEFTLAETRQWIRQIQSKKHKDPKNNCAVTIAVSNFKGGVTKTTTTATLAQGLSLRGYEVLVIDLDPQGSLSTLFGMLPDIDVEEDQTIMRLYAGDESTVEYAIRPTYWGGIDIIAGAPELHSAEFMLPARRNKDPGFEFWRVLDIGLDQAREKYDVILIDTPPSLSYTTLNALMAADGIIMPLPPSPLDFASSAQFWSLANEIMKTLPAGRGQPEKRFNFIDVVLCRVDKSVGVSAAVRDWIIRAYGSKVLPVEIPKTSIADTASAGLGTVYDMQSTPSIAKTLKRAKDAYELLVEHVENQIQGVWAGLAEKYPGDNK